MKKNSDGLIPKAIQVLIDAVLIILSLFLACLFTGHQLCRPEGHIPGLLMAAPLFLIIKLSANYWMKIYRQIWRYVSIQDVFNIVKAVSSSSLVLMVVFAVFRWHLTDNLAIFALDWFFCVGFFSGVRFLRRYLTVKSLERRRPRIKRRRVLLYGAGATGEHILRRIQSDPYLKILPVGFIDDDSEKTGATLHGVEILGDSGRLGDLIEKFNVEELLVTTPSASKEKIETLFRITEEKGIDLKIIPPFYRILQIGSEAPPGREIDVQDLLGRDPIVPNFEFLGRALSGKRVLVTGGCGSIGKELIRQMLQFGPEKIIALDINETGIFWLDYELSRQLPKAKYALFLCDIRNSAKLEKIIDAEKPEVIYHAAAYKHVPLSQQNPSEYVLTNVYGVNNLIEMARSRGFIKKFCLISTDKAVKPVNVMGATKRLAEILVTREAKDDEEKKVTFVRFGNVLGSRGSFVPLLKDMIARGGPIQVTHPDAERFFMDIHEASHLVLQAPFFVGSGTAFILDMGAPVKIVDLAKLAVRLSGYSDRAIPMTYTGLRPGEKISEELFDPSFEKLEKTKFNKIFALIQEETMPSANSEKILELISLAQKGDEEGVRRRLKDFFPDLVSA